MDVHFHSTARAMIDVPFVWNNHDVGWVVSAEYHRDVARINIKLDVKHRLYHRVCAHLRSFNVVKFVSGESNTAPDRPDIHPHAPISKRP